MPTYDAQEPAGPGIPKTLAYACGKGPVKRSMQPNSRPMRVRNLGAHERGGEPIAKAIAKSRAPSGVAYFVVSYPDPDGAALNTRGNAWRVDLSRNFAGWKRNGRPGSTRRTLLPQ